MRSHRCAFMRSVPQLAASGPTVSTALRALRAPPGARRPPPLRRPARAWVGTPPSAQRARSNVSVQRVVTVVWAAMRVLVLGRPLTNTRVGACAFHLQHVRRAASPSPAPQRAPVRTYPLPTIPTRASPIAAVAAVAAHTCGMLVLFFLSGWAAQPAGPDRTAGRRWPRVLCARPTALAAAAPRRAPALPVSPRAAAGRR